VIKTRREEEYDVKMAVGGVNNRETETRARRLQIASLISKQSSEMIEQAKIMNKRQREWSELVDS
jgi:hypothetical protein